MICCNRHYGCDYCPHCGRYLGHWCYPAPPPWYARPWCPPPPIYPPPRPFLDVRSAVREGRHAVGMR